MTRPAGLHTNAQPVTEREWKPKPVERDERDEPIPYTPEPAGAYRELMFRKAIGMGMGYGKAREYADALAARRNA